MNQESMKALVSAFMVIACALAGALGIDLDADALQNVLSAVLLLAATVYGVWKNHNFTQAAQEGQKVVDAIKNGKAEVE